MASTRGQHKSAGEVRAPGCGGPAPNCRSALPEFGQALRVKRYEYVGPPLTRESAAALLSERGINPVQYSLTGAQIFDGFVRRQTPEGWVVFYAERGHDTMHAVHASEGAAAQDLFERLRLRVGDPDLQHVGGRPARALMARARRPPMALSAARRSSDEHG
jgi:hypothetical protein